MARLFGASKETRAAFRKCRAQLFVCGGHGGLVTYDGEGGPMVKEGGPMDRLFLLRTDGRMLGDAGLDIQYGHINIRTGRLKGGVRVQSEKRQDTCAVFRFRGLDDKSAFEIKGGVLELGLPRDTVLIRGDIAPSTMVWESGDRSGKEPSLPYVAFHPSVSVHPDLLEWFGLPRKAVPGGAETGWCKFAPAAMDIRQCGSQGVAFRTQQHLGHLRVLL